MAIFIVLFYLVREPLEEPVLEEPEYPPDERIDEPAELEERIEVPDERIVELLLERIDELWLAERTAELLVLATRDTDVADVRDGAVAEGVRTTELVERDGVTTDVLLVALFVTVERVALLVTAVREVLVTADLVIVLVVVPVRVPVVAPERTFELPKVRFIVAV